MNDPLEDLRVRARLMSDLHLDLSIAAAQARGPVYAAHGLPDLEAAVWSELQVFADVRQERRQMSSALEDALYPGETPC